ncbi:MAG: ribosome silencing factor [Bacteriovoracaceae bacterium]|jgi:ribosome-associated protein|nr:ribosome silencing factor [Bacteriovoracaceae bacterium]
MSTNEFLDKEIKKIIEDKKWEFPVNNAMAGAYVMGHFKGINLKILDLRSTSGIADLFVLGSATNQTQAAAMAEEISKQMRNNGYEAISKEGLKQTTDWILLDYGDIIFHVFLESSRYVYDLDNLYSKATTVEIPEEYYYSDSSTTTRPVGDDGRGYF